MQISQAERQSRQGTARRSLVVGVAAMLVLVALAVDTAQAKSKHKHSRGHHGGGYSAGGYSNGTVLTPYGRMKAYRPPLQISRQF
jgi:hypothetical protein